VVRKTRLRKTTDDENEFWCAGGAGLLREEVWVDDDDMVVRYNLAFLLPHRFPHDNGRVLGFDNAHGVHERHYMGDVKQVSFKDYRDTAERFFQEVRALRRAYED
jgi:hypothetical protein